MKRVAIYARFSSDSQRSESIDAQLRACNSYASSKGWVVIKEYCDRGISGTSDNRPEFLQMIDDSKAGNFEAIIVHKLDRFSRNVQQTIGYISELKDCGVELQSVIEQFDDTPEGEFMRNTMSNISQFYSRNLAREVMKGLKENAYKATHTGGIPPLGLKVNELTRKYEIEAKKAVVVQKIYSMYIEGKTHPEIIKELNDCGYTNKLGKAFTKNSILSILRNSKYVGEYVWNKSVAKNSKGKRNGNKQKPESEIIRIPDAIPAIIDKDSFAKVQAIISARAKGEEPRRRATTYVLSGLIKCGGCGSSMHGNIRRAKTRPNPNWKEKPEYVSYRCGGRKNKVNCDVPEIRKEYLEAFVLDELEKLVCDERNLKHLLGLLNNKVLQEAKINQEKIEIVKGKLAKIEKEISNLVKAIASGVDAEEIVAELSKKKIQKVELGSELSRLEGLDGTTEITIDKMKEIVDQLKSFLLDNTMPELKALLKKFVKSITVGKEEIEVIFNLFFSFGLDYEYLYIKSTIRREDLYVPLSRKLSLKIQRFRKLERGS